MTVREMVSILQKVKDQDKEVLSRYCMGNGYGEASVMVLKDEVRIFSEEFGDDAEFITLDWDNLLSSKEDSK